MQGKLPARSWRYGDDASADARDVRRMKAWRKGDPAAFDALYGEHRAALYRYLLNGCGDATQAQELFQDIWLRVIDARNQYVAEAPFRAWLYRIARNRLIDHYRRGSTASHDPLTEENMSTVTEIAKPLQPDEIVTLRERHEILLQALQRLPMAQREAIVLQHVTGMSLAEIAYQAFRDRYPRMESPARTRLEHALVLTESAEPTIRGSTKPGEDIGPDRE